MLQHQQLINRAKSLGISVEDVSSLMQQPAAILDFNGQSELVMDGVPTSWINVRSQLYCDNKQLTKAAYELLDIPHPKSIIFQNAKSPELTSFYQQGQTFVCKPLDATNGIGVIMGIKSLEEVKTYYENHKHLNTMFLLEEEIAGKDLRIHVINGKIIAACIREPAYVIGNGTDDLQTLIEKRRAVMRTQNPNNFLEIDAATEALLQEQQISLSDIPDENLKIQLKYVSNMAQGGIAIDVTDEIHPVYQDWVTALSNYLNTGYFGLDLMTINHQENPHGHSWVLEINARADWLHHTFSERRTHDMADIILKAIF